jgi:NADH-quinone oxidoreductase subunit N
MNLAAFAVIAAEENETGRGDELSALSGLGARRPWLAWPMTIAMLALAGIPGTVGFIGKFQLIHALVDGDYTWLAIVLVIGSMISLGYYLRVVATMWMGSGVPVPVATPAPATAAGGLAPIAGGSPEADEPDSSAGAPRSAAPVEGWPGAAQSASQPEVVLVGVLFGAASIFFGIFPSPLFNLVGHAGHAIGGIF